MKTMDVQREMPRYICHKHVWALKIKNMHPDSEANGVRLVFAEEGYGSLTVDFGWYYKHKPEAGGYYVVYKDGYKSYSPSEAFEGGYTLEAPTPPAVEQSSAQSIRDAALEEAASQCDDIYSWPGALAAGIMHKNVLSACAAAIRALKSQPASKKYSAKDVLDASANMYALGLERRTSQDREDAERWRQLDILASDPEFVLDVNAGGWAALKTLIDAARAEKGE